MFLQLVLKRKSQEGDALREEVETEPKIDFHLRTVVSLLGFPLTLSLEASDIGSTKHLSLSAHPNRILRPNGKKGSIL